MERVCARKDRLQVPSRWILNPFFYFPLNRIQHVSTEQETGRGPITQETCPLWDRPLAPGTWNLEPGTWNLAPGTWNLEPAAASEGGKHKVRRLVCGVCVSMTTVLVTMRGRLHY